MVVHDLGIRILEEVNLDRDINKIRTLLDKNKRLSMLVGKGNRFGEILYCTTSKKDFENRKKTDLKRLPNNYFKTKTNEDEGFLGIILVKAISPAEAKRLKL